MHHLVTEFHQKHGAPVGEMTAENILLRQQLMAEELGELLLANHKKDELLFLDALCDLLYVTVGTEVALFTIPRRPDLNCQWQSSLQSVAQAVGRAIAETTVNACVLSAIVEIQLFMFQSGYPLEAFYEVHRSNMTKKVSGDTRVLDKGDEYSPPNLKPFLVGRFCKTCRGQRELPACGQECQLGPNGGYCPGPGECQFEGPCFECVAS